LRLIWFGNVCPENMALTKASDQPRMIYSMFARVDCTWPTAPEALHVLSRWTQAFFEDRLKRGRAIDNVGRPTVHLERCRTSKASRRAGSRRPHGLPELFRWCSARLSDGPRASTRPIEKRGGLPPRSAQAGPLADDSDAHVKLKKQAPKLKSRCCLA